MSKNDLKTAQGTYREVPITSLFVDPRYQRERNAAQAKRIGANFEFEFYGTPTVSHRGSGRYALLDGQQRTEGLRLKYPGGVYPNGKEVMVGVLVASKKLEHEIYVAMNQAGTRRSVTPNELFKANLGGGEKTEVTIRRILLDYGIEIKFTKGRPEIGMTKAPAAFKNVFEAAGSVSRFKQVVELLVVNFSRPDDDAVEAAALQADFLKGLASYLKTTGYTLPRISTALEAADVPAADIVQRARLIHLNSRYSQLDGIRQEIERLVDANLPKSRRRAA